MKKKLALGLMSGTSADGVSIALCAFENHRFELKGYKTFPYPARLASEIRQSQKVRASQISQLNVRLGNFFAESALAFLREVKRSAAQIAVIGSHGQTIYHGASDKPRHTLQLGEPSVIAEATGIPVVADFRMRDLAAGGEGAPLIPFFDQYFFGNGKTRALQNIGGIANVTAVGSSRRPLAFDTGPGNCLMDLAIQKLSRGRLLFDKNGEMAACGIVNPKALKPMAAHPYFQKKPPKSTGRELFNENFIPKSLWKDKAENIMATLTYLTAVTIAQSYKRFIPYSLSEIIVSGGGSLNATLMKFLSELLSPRPVRSIQEWGIPPQAKEPMAFAFFALRALEGKTNHLPEITGARRACILGKIIPGR
jgi:anhydro-N-acetylmuramic acid kinase